MKRLDLFLYGIVEVKTSIEVFVRSTWLK